MAKENRGLGADRLRELARAGAAAALNELRAEIIAIERTFPELALPARRRAVSQAVQTAQKRTAKWSTEARAEVSARMKKYWAERRKAKAKAK